MSAFLKTLASRLADTRLDEPRPYADLELPKETEQKLLAELSRSRLRSAAVLVGILPAEDGESILLTRRSDALKHHPGQISFPGGSREDSDADLVDTALREAEEEILLPPRHVEVIGYLPDYPTITGYRVTPVVGTIEVTAGHLIKPDGVEAMEVINLPLEVALDPDAYEKKMIERNGLSVPVFHLHFDNHDVWGATAGMLYQLCRHFHGDYMPKSTFTRGVAAR